MFNNILYLQVMDNLQVCFESRIWSFSQTLVDKSKKWVFDCVDDKMKHFFLGHIHLNLITRSVQLFEKKVWLLELFTFLLVDNHVLRMHGFVNLKFENLNFWSRLKMSDVICWWSKHWNMAWIQNIIRLGLGWQQ